MTVHCPHCGQRVLIRLGTMLSPREVDVFDAIARQSESGGIRSDILASMFKGGQGCLKVHISNINKKLFRNGWQIVCAREGSSKGFYRIRQQRRHKLRQNLELFPQSGQAADADDAGMFAEVVRG